MNEFEKKYGIKEDERTKAFHRSRRMFCVYDDKLFIGDEGSEDSHAKWISKEGFTPLKGGELVDEIVRGIVDHEGNIRFYIGYDFEVNDEVEVIFFKHLKELVNKLNLSLDSKVFGGSIKQEHSAVWPSRKEYGSVKDCLGAL